MEATYKVEFQLKHHRSVSSMAILPYERYSFSSSNPLCNHPLQESCSDSPTTVASVGENQPGDTW